MPSSGGFSSASPMRAAGKPAILRAVSFFGNRARLVPAAPSCTALHGPGSPGRRRGLLGMWIRNASGSVVVVESPSKAKTIEKYLGKGYTVLASYGHIRDLIPKSGSVKPEENFAMEWAVSERSESHIRAIESAVAGSQRLFLATDPDREGEAISWHVQEYLQERNLLRDVEVKRVAFNEITKSAVLDAFSRPREVSGPLVEAYLARRALDYLVGFTLSPLLWRKLPGSKSAGRVQSVALQVLCEREAAIERFVSQEFWTVQALLHDSNRIPFQAKLTHLDGMRLGKMDLGDEASATAAAGRIASAELAITAIKKSQSNRHPPPPFITSTLQQEASNVLGFGATQTMSIAQRLYEGVDGSEGGLITYMRTDGLQLSEAAVEGLRIVAVKEFGSEYIPSEPRVYKTTAKNAQEAHEAIRPTDPANTPAKVAPLLDAAQLKLYTLIWQRAVGCQMTSAVMDQVKVEVCSAPGDVQLSATASAVKFKGWLAVRDIALSNEAREDEDIESSDEGGAEAGEPNREVLSRLLLSLQEGAQVTTRTEDVNAEQHWTQPPPRYTEASLVKALEEEGIGRPSTYAPIMKVLVERQYVVKDGRRLIPVARGRVVTSFLSHYFSKYVNTKFSAEMEMQLDLISAGDMDHRKVLGEFWDSFHGSVDSMKDLSITEVIDVLDAELGVHFFTSPTNEEGAEGRTGISEEAVAKARRCPQCTEGRLGLKLSKNGGFIGCSNYPECKYTRPLEILSGEEDAAGPRLLGVDPKTGLEITVRIGPYGPYVQRGGAPLSGGEAPPGDIARSSLPRGTNAAAVTFEQAQSLLALPMVLGAHPSDGQAVHLCIGPFGYYVKHADVNASIPKKVPLEEVNMVVALELLERKAARLADPNYKPRGGRKKVAKGKAVKKTDGPKRARNAYIFFTKENRERVKAANPEFKLGDITKALGEEWKAMDDAARAPFQALAEADKARYLAEVAALPTVKGIAGGRSRASKAATGSSVKGATKGEQGLKRPVSSYILFCKERRPTVVAENPEVTRLGDISKLLGEQWRGLGEEERAVYEAQAIADKERYASELHTFNA